MSARAAHEAALRFLQHGDSQFPSGSFAFSSGLAGLVDDGHVSSEALPTLLESWLRNQWAQFERVFVTHAWRSSDDLDALRGHDRLLECMLLGPAERAGSHRAGAALLAAHRRIDTEGAAELHEAVESGHLHGHCVIIQGALWSALGLGLTQAELMSAYSFLNAASSAAVRLGVCGAVAQQRIFNRLIPVIAEMVERPLEEDVRPASFNPLAGIALLRHPLRSGALFST